MVMATIGYQLPSQGPVGKVRFASKSRHRKRDVRFPSEYDCFLLKSGLSVRRRESSVSDPEPSLTNLSRNRR